MQLPRQTLFIMYHSPNIHNIRSWAEEDRPREKMITMGERHLTDAELLAILLGSGSKEVSAVALAKQILAGADQNLHDLSRMSIQELMQFRGVGEAKAVTIAAALELGRRRQLSVIRDKPLVRCSRDAYDAIAPLLMDLPHEEFWILLLNRANAITGRSAISKGGVSGTVVDAKLVFKKALDALASAVILCHNHPSGNLKPSQADIDLTRKLRKAGESLDIGVLDHLIVTGHGYYSFSDEGML